MTRRNQDISNRGRFQAQGDGLEESKSWAVEVVPTKRNGYSYIEDLKGQLSPAEFIVRLQCFDKAKKWVEEAPANGYVVSLVIKTSFPLKPPKKGIRVDGEIFSGAAFRD